MLGGDRVLHPFACLETIDKRGAIRLADDVDTVVAIGAAVIPFGAIAAGRDVIIGVDAIVIGDARRPHEIGRAPSELQSLMRSSYAVFCLKTKTRRYKLDKTKKK